MPLLADPAALQEAVDQIAAWAEPRKPDLVLGAEARGYITGGALACGRLRLRRRPQAGEAAVADGGAEVRARVRLRLARGARRRDRARASACCPRRRARDGRNREGDVELVEQLGGEVVGLAFIIELEFLNGRERLDGLRRATR